MKDLIKIAFIIFLALSANQAVCQEASSEAAQTAEQHDNSDPVDDTPLSEAFALKLIETAKERSCAKNKDTCGPEPVIDYDTLPVHKLSDDSTFQGTIINGLKQGKGRLTYPSGDIYEGDFVDDLRHGKGKLVVKESGLHYIGDFELDKMTGKTVMYTIDMVYEGYIKDGLKEGIGRYVWFGEDPYIYEGEYTEGIMNGTGRITYDNGSVYYGMFLDGKRHGPGKLSVPEGSKYEGYWENDRKHGKGLQQWADGRHYVGSWVGGKIEGIGEYSWKDGSKYLGEWKQGKFHGQGQYVIAGVGKYEGYFTKGKMEGRGRFIWENGTKYEGEWKKSRRDGRGLLTMINGEVYSGMFLNDLPDGLGAYEFINGTKYYGEWTAGKKTGGGMFSYGNGTDIQGIWVEDEFIWAEPSTPETNFDAALVEGIDYDELNKMLREMNQKKRMNNSNLTTLNIIGTNTTESNETIADNQEEGTNATSEATEGQAVGDTENINVEGSAKEAGSTNTDGSGENSELNEGSQPEDEEDTSGDYSEDFDPREANVAEDSAPRPKKVHFAAETDTIKETRDAVEPSEPVEARETTAHEPAETQDKPKADPEPKISEDL